MKCGTCGAEILNSSGICVHCAANERTGLEDVVPTAERSPGSVTVAMRYCGSCGQPLPSGANFCTRCGSPVSFPRTQIQPDATHPGGCLKRTVGLILLLCVLPFALLVVLALGFTIYHRMTTPSAQLQKEDAELAAKRETERAQRETTQGRKENPSESTSQIGVPIKVGDFTYTINEVKWKSSIGDGELVQQRPDAAYLVIDLTVMNHGSEPHEVEPPLLVDSRGRTYRWTSNLFISQGSEFLLKELNPQVRSRGSVVFDVPYGSYSLKLAGGGGLFSRSKIVPIVEYRAVQ